MATRAGPTHLRHGILVVATCVTNAVATAAGAAPAMAQAVAFDGYTAGCFGAPCGVMPDALQTTAVFGLGYENAHFGGTTTGGVASLVAGANAQGVRDLNNLGAFYLSSEIAVYTGTPFFLSIHLDAPGIGTVGVPATLTGFVRLGSEVSGVYIDFDDAPRLLPFTLNGASSVLALTVNDVSIDAPSPGQTFARPVTGQLAIITAVPEPATLGLVALGLALGGVVTRRSARRRSPPRRGVGSVTR